MRILGVVVVAIAAGCGDPDPPGAIDAPPPSPDAAPLTGRPVGTVWAVENHGELEYASVHAEMSYDGVYSDLVDALMTPTVTAGACRLLERVPAACDPACPANYYCVPDGSCRYGYWIDPGTVTVTGVGAAPIELVEASFWSEVVAPGDIAPGAEITAVSTGATVPAFSLAATVPPELDPAAVVPGGVLALDDATGATLTWPAAAGARYKLRFGTAHGHGGSSSHVVICEGADTGAVTIAPAIVQALPALVPPICQGLTCVVATLRRTVETTTPVADGEVTLAVGSTVGFWPSH